jgi:hypothetical protein
MQFVELGLAVVTVVQGQPVPVKRWAGAILDEDGVGSCGDATGASVAATTGGGA